MLAVRSRNRHENPSHPRFRHRDAGRWSLHLVPQEAQDGRHPGLWSEPPHGPDLRRPKRVQPGQSPAPVHHRVGRDRHVELRVARRQRRRPRQVRGLHPHRARRLQGRERGRLPGRLPAAGVDLRIARDHRHRQRGRALRQAAARRGDARWSGPGGREVPHGVLRRRHQQRDPRRDLQRRFSRAIPCAPARPTSCTATTSAPSPSARPTRSTPAWAAACTASAWADRPRTRRTPRRRVATSRCASPTRPPRSRAARLRSASPCARSSRARTRTRRRRRPPTPTSRSTPPDRSRPRSR